jgi:cytochrome c553
MADEVRGRAGRAALAAGFLWLSGAIAWAQAVPPQAGMRADTLAACVACHGPGGNSQAAAVPSIAAQPRLFIENQLVLMREGLRDVPVMADVVRGMTDAEIAALAQHFAAQTPQGTDGRVHRAQRLRGAEISRLALCGTCHLADYTGQSQVPRLAGQQEVYLLASMKAFRDHPGPGRDTIMAATLQGMTDAQLADLAHYFATTRP